ncbi:unnamed protein product [Arctogadus glacialis]
MNLHFRSKPIRIHLEKYLHPVIEKAQRALEGSLRRVPAETGECQGVPPPPPPATRTNHWPGRRGSAVGPNQAEFRSRWAWPVDIYKTITLQGAVNHLRLRLRPLPPEFRRGAELQAFSGTIELQKDGRKQSGISTASSWTHSHPSMGERGR